MKIWHLRAFALFLLFFAFSLHAQQRIVLGVLTDCQYCDCEESGQRQYRLSLAKLDSCITFFNSEKLDMVFHLGDLIDHNFSSFDSVLPRFKKSIAPVQFVLGNHDFMVRKRQKSQVLGKIDLAEANYITVLGEWKFITLNGDDLSYFAPQTARQKDERDSLVVWLAQNFRANPMPWNGAVGRTQMTWLEAELVKAQKAGQKVIILIHFPSLPQAGHNLWNDKQMVALISAYPCVKAYFNGHYHPGNYVCRNGIHFINFKGMVDTRMNAFATVTLTSDSIFVDGQGRQPSFRLKIEGGNLPVVKVPELGNYVKIGLDESLDEVVEKAANVTPSDRQAAWQQLEFISFVHFGLNTFYNREWGEGDYDPKRFNPTQLDTRQWVRTLRDAGSKMVIITAKHHDGFCLWPSRTTMHSVAASPWKGGMGDVVGELAAACKEYGLRFGIYLSPWDRHETTYGDSPAYNEFFRNQLRELLSNYGEISEVWFDGACAEGRNGRKQIYDWPSYYKIVRELQPGAVIAIMGPDVRWVGTESGYGRETEWSVLPGNTLDTDSIAASSQQNPGDGAFIPKDLMEEDLGGIDQLRRAKSLVWYPAETDVSIRPGWFYHPAEDARVKSPAKLVDIYYNSVGKNSVLLLNVPPDTLGLIHDNDVASLLGMRKILDETFTENLFLGARRVERDSLIEYAVNKSKTFNVAMLGEEISCGQRIAKFRIEAWSDGKWFQFTRGTTVGYKRLLRFPEVTASNVRIVIEQSRSKPNLNTFGLYREVRPPDTKSRTPRYIVTLGTEYHPKYKGGGPNTVVDGVRGSLEYNDHEWQGYEGVDFVATVDLGVVKPVASLSAGFLQEQESWIFMPVSVMFEISEDGITYSPVGDIQNDTSEREAGTKIRDYRIDLNARARFVRIHAKNRGICPAWHPGAGSKCWIFTDEIEIR